MEEIMRKYFTTGGVILSVLVLSFIIFNLVYINVWNFNLPKKDLKDIIVYTGDKRYLIDNYKDVLSLMEEMSHMKKLYKITPGNFGNKDVFQKYNQLLLQTKDNVTYGGTFWQDGNSVIHDNNGYYWKATDKLFEMIDEAVKRAKTLD